MTLFEKVATTIIAVAVLVAVGASLFQLARHFAVVNVASRIQDACKDFGQSLLISMEVTKHLPQSIHVRLITEKRVRGRETPVQIFAVEQ